MPVCKLPEYGDYSLEKCKDSACLLYETPPVGNIKLQPRSVQESLIGALQNGAKFKLGKGNVTNNAFEAAEKLLEREFPEVNSYC